MAITIVQQPKCTEASRLSRSGRSGTGHALPARDPGCFTPRHAIAAGAGSSVSLILPSTLAREQAAAEARKSLADNLANGSAPVSCPKCGEYQPGMRVPRPGRFPARLLAPAAFVVTAIAALVGYAAGQPFFANPDHCAAGRVLAIATFFVPRRPAASATAEESKDRAAAHRSRFKSMSCGNKKAGAIPGSWNEGVGEHVRTRSRPVAARPWVKPRNASAPHRTKKDRFFCRTDLRRSKIRSGR